MMSEQREEGRKHSQPENVQRATEMMSGQRQGGSNFQTCAVCGWKLVRLIKLSVRLPFFVWFPHPGAWSLPEALGGCGHLNINLFPKAKYGFCDP
jgi:hypothetical protein